MIKKIRDWISESFKSRHNYLLGEFSNTEPNKGHVDVFIYHASAWNIEKQKLSKTLNRISVLMVTRNMY